MNLGRVELDASGVTNGHPPVIMTGDLASGTVCVPGGILMLDESTGEFEAYDFADDEAGPGYVALEEITAETLSAEILLHGTFDASRAVTAAGAALTNAQLALIQKRSQIFFV